MPWPRHWECWAAGWECQWCCRLLSSQLWASSGTGISLSFRLISVADADVWDHSALHTLVCMDQTGPEVQGHEHEYAFKENPAPVVWSVRYQGNQVVVGEADPLRRRRPRIRGHGSHSGTSNCPSSLLSSAQAVGERAADRRHHQHELQDRRRWQVLRLAHHGQGAGTERLAYGASVEHQADLAAGRLGIAPEAPGLHRTEGYLVTRFITAKRMPRTSSGNPTTSSAWFVSDDLSTAGVPSWIASSTSSPGGNAHLRRRGKGMQVPLDFADWIDSRCGKWKIHSKRAPYTPTPCHDDLQTEWARRGRARGDGRDPTTGLGVRGMGDVFFDLGQFLSPP